MAVVHPATFEKKSAYDKYGTFDLKYKCQMDRDLSAKNVCGRC